MDGLYEQVLEAAAGGPVIAARPPRDSAAVVPWRVNDGQLEVLWIRRTPGQRFMGGWYAFPGGGLARGDRDLPLVGEPAGVADADPTGALPPGMLDGVELGPLLIPGLAAAALRELAEEIGWLAVDRGLDASTERRLIEAMRGGEGLGEILRRESLRLDAASLSYAGRWLTPPLGPMRFDNRFFLLPASGRRPSPWDREVHTAEWVRPAQAFQRWINGEVLAAPPVLHVLRVLAEIVPTTDGGLEPEPIERLTSPAEANLGPYRRIEFQPGVLQVPLRTATLPPAATTNCFILGDPGRRVVIDPGSAFAREQRRLLEVLAALPGGAGGVREIWLTHQHPDHVGGARSLAEQLGVPIAAHQETAHLLADRLEISSILQHGQQIRLSASLEVEILHTPGHAPGHLCFASGDRRWVLAGDMISGVSTIVIDPPQGNMDDYFSSLRRLADRDYAVVFPAHGPPQLGGRSAFSRTLEHRRERERKIDAAWRAGERNLNRLVEAAYRDEDLPEFVLPLARRQVEAHLRHLGRAAADPDESAAGGEGA